MAQTGYTPILIYASGTASSVPLAANLTSSASGAELALNYADGKLFYKDSGGVVQVLATKGGVGSSSNTQILYNSSGLVTGSANMTYNGSAVSLAANLLFTDNTYDIGASGATRPRSLYLGTNSYVAGKSLIGSVTTTKNLRVQESFAVVSVNPGESSGMALTTYSGTNTGYRPLLDFNRSAGTTDGSMTAVANTYQLGSVIFRGSDGTNFVDGAAIIGAVDSSVTTGAVPTALQFYTTATGAVALRYLISSDGTQSWYNIGSVTGNSGMTLNANGLAIGSNVTCPASTNFYIENASLPAIQLKNTGSTKNVQILFSSASTVNWRVGTDVSTNNGTNVFQIYNDASATPVITADAGLNVGIDVLPSSWDSTYKALQITGYGTNLVGYTSGGGSTQLVHNAYFNSSVWKSQFGTWRSAKMYMDGSGSTYFEAYNTAQAAGTTITWARTMLIEPTGYTTIGPAVPANRAANFTVAADTGPSSSGGSNWVTQIGTADGASAVLLGFKNQSGTKYPAIGAQSTTKLIMQPDGGQIVTPNQSAFIAYPVSSTTANPMVLDATLSTIGNRNGNFNTSTYTYTAPEDGYYSFTLIFAYSGGSVGGYMSLGVNGARARDFFESIGSLNTNQELHSTVVWYLSKNDAVTVLNPGNANFQGNGNANYYSAFMGYFIG